MECAVSHELAQGGSKQSFLLLFPLPRLEGCVIPLSHESLHGGKAIFKKKVVRMTDTSPSDKRDTRRTGLGLQVKQ